MRARTLQVLCLALGIALVAGVADAGPPEACGSKKADASATKAKARCLCWAQYFSGQICPGLADPTQGCAEFDSCYARAESKFQRLFQKAEKKGRGQCANPIAERELEALTDGSAVLCCASCPSARGCCSTAPVIQ